LVSKAEGLADSGEPGENGAGRGGYRRPARPNGPVKWRRTPADLDRAIDHYRLRRVAAAAEAIASRYVRAGDDQRIDVLLLAPGRLPRHIVNAWMG
jgi:hypothetical protein